MPAGTHIGSLDLQVANMEQALDFYGAGLGLQLIEREGDRASLSATGLPPYLLALQELRSAIPAPRTSTGLYHVAIRLPDRPALARLLRRLLDRRVAFQGAADHGVSEALYLADPEGNGIELYVDRPPQAWPRQGDKIAMTSDPLDIRGLLGEAADGGAAWVGIHPETVIGHIHLKVADLDSTEHFYHGLLGFDVTQRDYPGARFFAAGGYHHHLGTNIWESRRGAPPPANSTGLLTYFIAVPDGGALEAVRARLLAAGTPVEIQADARSEAGPALRDPSSILLKLGAPVSG